MTDKDGKMQNALGYDTPSGMRAACEPIAMGAQD